jgi:dCMP deaminase
MKTDWHKRFFDLAFHFSRWSKDSTQVGAVAVNSEKRLLSMGYNGIPSGCDDNLETRKERPTKYFYTEHAERNLIYNAAREGVNLKGSTLYCTMFPCADCARGIIQTGIKEVVAPKPNLELEKWGEHFKVTLELFKEAGVNYIEYSP